MKRIFAFIALALSLIFILSACGGNDMSSTPQQSPDAAPDVSLDTAPDAGTGETPPSAVDPLPPGDVSSIKVLYNRISWRANMDGTSKIRSVKELQEYYENLKAADMNELDDDLVWRFTGDQYNDDFFKEYFLVLITVSEPSGSNRHELVSIADDNGMLTINIDRHLPEIGTADMAGWLIIIELSSNYSTYETNVVFTDVFM